MGRRVEQQLKRDWLLGFSSCNLLLRASLNMYRSVYSYERVAEEDGGRAFAAKELEEGAINVCNALVGKYRDLDCSSKKSTAT